MSTLRNWGEAYIQESRVNFSLRLKCFQNTKNIIFLMVGLGGGQDEPRASGAGFKSVV